MMTAVNVKLTAVKHQMSNWQMSFVHSKQMNNSDGTVIKSCSCVKLVDKTHFNDPTCTLGLKISIDSTHQSATYKLRSLS